jgi:hypothetical protein
MSFIDKLGVYIDSPSRKHNMTSAFKEKASIFLLHSVRGPGTNKHL